MPRYIYYIAIGWIVIQFLGIVRVTVTDKEPDMPDVETPKNSQLHYLNEGQDHVTMSGVIHDGTSYSWFASSTVTCTSITSANTRETYCESGN